MHKMRNALLIFICLSYFSCNKPTVEENIQNKIEEYLESNIKEKTGYKPILFGKLDSSFTTVNKTPEYKKNNDVKNMYYILSHMCMHGESENTNLAEAYADSVNYQNMICDSLESLFVPEVVGWKMQYIYQTKDAEKGIVANSFIFYFDKELKNITEVEQIYKKLPIKTYNQNIEFYGIK